MLGSEERREEGEIDPKAKELFLWEEGSLLQKTMAGLNTLRKNKQFCDVILQVNKS